MASSPYQKSEGPSFFEQLKPDEQEFFSRIGKQTFSQQAVAFLNAFWKDVKDQAEFIYGTSWEYIKMADMKAKNISLIHQYKEGCELSFDIGLYFYEQLCKFCENNAPKVGPYKRSVPEMMTALKRKTELSSIDVNRDLQISFLEVLLHQYRDVANPTEFCKRSMTFVEHPAITEARALLEDVNTKIAAYESEKQRLTTDAEGTGVKAGRAKNELAQIEAGLLRTSLNEALIKAEAAVRKAIKEFGGAVSDAGPSQGAMWWMDRDLREKQEKYGPKKKA